MDVGRDAAGEAAAARALRYRLRKARERRRRTLPAEEDLTPIYVADVPPDGGAALARDDRRGLETDPQWHGTRRRRPTIWELWPVFDAE